MTARPHPESKRSLHGPLQSFDLDTEGSRNAITLRDSEDLNVVLLAMKEGDRLDEHSAPSPITLSVHEGRIRFSAADEDVEAEAGTVLMQLSDELKQDEIREDTLRNLGEQLEAHIRLEERQVFPLIEETLPEHALQEVSSRLEVFEPGSPHERWVPAKGLSFDPWPGPGDSEGGGSD